MRAMRVEAFTGYGDLKLVQVAKPIRTDGRVLVRAFERHYKAAELAEQWSLSPKIIRKIFAAEPGVLKVDHTELRNKRGYCSLRIPESVALAVYKRMSV